MKAAGGGKPRGSGLRERPRIGLKGGGEGGRIGAGMGGLNVELLLLRCLTFFRFFFFFSFFFLLLCAQGKV